MSQADLVGVTLVVTPGRYPTSTLHKPEIRTVVKITRPINDSRSKMFPSLTFGSQTFN